ncbi:hypothetical protein ISCGN_000604 [Ixodes scapularis]
MNWCSRCQCLIFFLTLIANEVRCPRHDPETVGEVTSTAAETDRTGRSTPGAVTLEARSMAHSFVDMRRWIMRNFQSRSQWTMSAPKSETLPPDLTAHTHPTFGLTRGPFCNMTAFMKLQRDCWKASAVFSSEPGGVCSLKAGSLFRRCLVRVSTVTSCSGDERALKRIRNEVDSQRAKCAGVPMPNSGHTQQQRTRRFYGAFGPVGPSILTILFDLLHR